MFCTYLFQHFPRDRRDKGGEEDGSVQKKTVKRAAWWRKSEELVLSGGCSFDNGDVCKFVFVLKEEGQFLEGFVSGTEGTRGGLLLPPHNLAPASPALDW